jgi:hypothetical protein
MGHWDIPSPPPPPPLPATQSSCVLASRPFAASLLPDSLQSDLTGPLPMPLILATLS